MAKTKIVFSMRTSIMISIALSLLSLALIFLYLAYSGMTRNIIEATELNAKYIADTVNQSIKLTLAPCEVSLNLLRLSGIGNSGNTEERLKFIPTFAQVLNTNKIVDSVFIGYDNGEFFLLRRYTGVDNEYQPEQVSGREYFILQTRSLTENETSFIWELWFFDEELNLLSKQETNLLSIEPRNRPWYKAAKTSRDVVVSRSYLSSDLGVAMAKTTEADGAVLAMYVTTTDLSNFLTSLKMTPTTQIVLLDESAEILAYPDAVNYQYKKNSPDGSFTLDSLQMPIFDEIFKENELALYEVEGQKWYGLLMTLDFFYGNDLKMIVAIPGQELLSSLWQRLLVHGIAATFVLIIVLTGCWIFGNYFTKPLLELTAQVKSLRQFNFRRPINVHTRIKEVIELGDVLNDMSNALSKFQDISIDLNLERNFDIMIPSVLKKLLSIVHLESGAVYFFDDVRSVLFLSSSEGDHYDREIAIDIKGKNDDQIIYDLKKIISQNNIYVLLRNREKDLIGVFCVFCPDYQKSDNGGSYEELRDYIHTIASSIAIAIETHQHIEGQKAIFDSIIKLIADAIDAKSRYTGGHCRRVPELSLMLLDKVKYSNDPHFKDFSMSQAEEEEFRIAAWLHDCGKITTPEYVVDKATKLETIYNRIHEIRTRFEVLHREAKIKYLEAIINKEDAGKAKKICEEEQKALQEDFEFVAKCNIGGESMLAEDIERVTQIGKKVWLRYFNSNLGLSNKERQLYETVKEPQILPVKEYLLADKEIHIVPWGKNIPPVQLGDPNNKWNFDMKLPKYMYNYGEIYNLSIGRGTLTDEERFKINNHIVQTLCMLSGLNWPRSMKNIPYIASSHHENLLGTGYPKKLKAKDLGVADRIIAIADIFEALTAADRPYKDGNSLSKSLSIIKHMVTEGKLDAYVFNVFLKSEVYMEYANKYLDKHQIDTINIDDYLC